MSNVVVGVSGSDGSWQALSWAVAEVAATNGRLVVAHSCSPESALAASRATTGTALLSLVLPEVARRVAAAQLRLGGNRVTVVVRPDAAGELLTRLASPADLLVVGAPMRPGWLERASTTHHVVRHARGPVVVVRGSSAVRAGLRPGPFRGNVVVGVDGSEPARPALAFGFAYADQHRLPLVALYVTPRVTADVWYDEELLETHLVDGSADLTLLAAEVEPWQHKYPQVAVKRAVFAGSPLPGLLRAADGAALLVVGDRGMGPVRRALLGSVSRGAIERAGEPVAVVRGDGERSLSSHAGS